MPETEKWISCQIFVLQRRRYVPGFFFKMCYRATPYIACMSLLVHNIVHSVWSFLKKALAFAILASLTSISLAINYDIAA